MTAYEQELAQIIESARRLGVELDEEEALQWLTAISAWQAAEVEVDEASGVYGHRVTLLDFSPEDLAYFREVGRLVKLEGPADVVESALALSGSAAQSKVQAYPGDCDYFQRVNIKAPTREEACRILADIMREKALSTYKGKTFRLVQVRFGSYAASVIREGKVMKPGASITWTPEEVRAGQIECTDVNGNPLVITWEDATADPGWCKMDWVVADPVRRKVANASNMLDVTWEAPDGGITPLDGYLDPYFQEVYLEAESIPVFSKLIKHLSPDALDEYLNQLENEVRKYAKKEPKNYGKAARRMYNIFRLNGRYAEAAYLRELFDEPATALYQVAALVRSLDEAADPDSTITVDALLAQTDELIISAIRVLEGEEEEATVRQLLQLRNSLAGMEHSDHRAETVEAVRSALLDMVNDYFYQRLIAVPSIREYLETL